MLTAMTDEELQAVRDAAKFAIASGSLWIEIENMTVGDMCAANQDAFVDDFFEEHRDDNPAEIADLIEVYDGLLGTHRRAELPLYLG